MARGLNKVMLIGHLGGDPTARSTPGGISIANFSVATTESWKDKNSGQMKERTDWHNCDAWGGLADVATKYMHKGSKVYVEGSLRTEEWKDKDTQQPRKATKIRVESLLLLDGRQGAAAAPAASAAQPEQSQQSFDDDIPF